MRGGTVRYLIDVVRATPGDHHVALAQHDGVAGRSGALADTTAAARLASDGATLHVVDMRRNPLHPANAGAAVTVRRVIAEVAPEVVHGHSSVGGAVARLAGGWAGVPCAYTPNGLMTSPAAVVFERCLGGLTGRFVAVSATEGEQVVARGLVPRERMVVIPNGIDLAPAAPTDIDVRSRLGLPPGTPLVATVARVAAQKAPEQFVRACAAVARRRPAVHFLLVGLGPRQAKVDRELARAGPALAGRFHQIPHLADAAAVMGQFDVFVLLSRYEGGPYVPLEAMRAGVPVVLSDVVGNQDTVTPGTTGFLVPFGDADAAATAVIELLDDGRLRESVVTAARARLAQDFDVKVMGERLARLYSELAAGTRSQHPQAAATEVGAVLEASRRQGFPVQLVGGPAPVGGVGEHVVNGQQPARRHLRGPAPVVGPRHIGAVAPVDEQQRQGRAPVGGHHRRRPHHQHYRRLQAGRLEGPAGPGQGVHAAGGGVDDGRVVVFPAHLVLFRAPVVVDREQGAPPLLGGGAQVERRFPAIGPDLQQRSRRRRQGGPVQGLTFGVGHEPLDGPGERERGLGSGLGVTARHRSEALGPPFLRPWPQPGIPVRPSRAGVRSWG